MQYLSRNNINTQIKKYVRKKFMRREFKNIDHVIVVKEIEIFVTWNSPWGVVEIQPNFCFLPFFRMFWKIFSHPVIVLGMHRMIASKVIPNILC